MLTSDLVRVKTKDGHVVPRYLAHKDRERLTGVADALIGTYQTMVGSTRAELEEAAGAIPFTARDRAVVAGLRKLCDDRTELEQDSALDPETVRSTLFAIAARGHRGAGLDRNAALAEAALVLETTSELLERSLFADLRDAQAVRGFQPLRAADLFDRYDLGLAQALLLRAKHLTLTFKDSRPTVVRDVFRSARFHGLLHTIERRGSDWIVTFDGPFSLFESVQKYGIRLAMFLPSALALQVFSIHAEIVWGPRRTNAELAITQTDGLVAPRERRLFARPEVEALKTAFEGLGATWDVADNDRILLSKRGVAVVPDLVFSSRETGEEVFLEVFGFWSRQAVWNRVEQIQAGMPARLILAVSKQARVSEEVLDEQEVGSSLYVFKTAISAKEVLARLSR